ncbi:FBXO18 [Mytilus edulis]|uniref:DNA 3'-5' helicase n=1 Tax=Mytilus edulis TaxID=6550 RepID=A0A8S3VM23_MYTED|nr:FBXO18 [Mytilus edulis]
MSNKGCIGYNSNKIINNEYSETPSKNNTTISECKQYHENLSTLTRKNHTSPGTLIKNINSVKCINEDEDSLDYFVPTQPKRRKIHMTSDMCQKFADSPDHGGKILTNPAGSQLPNTDINLHHLAPRYHTNRNVTAFQSARYACGSKINSNDVGVEISNNSSYKSGLTSSFKSGQFGGFTSAAKLHNESPDLSSHFDMKPSTSFTATVSPRKKSKTSVNTDSKQKSITTFFGASSFCNKRNDSSKSDEQITSSHIVVSDSPISTPEKSEAIIYGTPVKMYSPIKNVQGSSNIYISDDSPSDSQKSQTSRVDVGNNSVMKQLFEGQKHYQSNKIVQSKSKKSNSKSKRRNSVKKTNSRVTALKQSTIFSPGNISSEDDDILCTEVDLASEKYGLMGSSLSSQPGQEIPQIDYFERLPDELLEIIFAQLPMLDLCLNSNRVCMRWSHIISSDRFVPWKKKYNRLKKGLPGAMTEIKSILVDEKMNKFVDFLTGLIRYMKKFKPITAGNIIQCLEKHSKYNWAKALMKERLTDCLLNEEPNPWCCITVLVIISQTVYDIQEILQCLLVPSSQCTSIELLECLYCIATFLYAFKTVKSDDVWNGMHYRLFYALYLYENASATSLGDLQNAITNKSGQQSLIKYSRSDCTVKMTHEQSRIVSYNVEPGEVIKIVAFAGTGKTTTLVRYTKMRPSMRFLLVVYNKSIKEHANTQFPGNVVCKTGHGLAFQYTGRRYIAAKKLRNLKVYEITQALPPRKGDNLFIRAKFVMDTVNTFISSADPCITTEHVPEKRMDDNGQMTYIDSDKKNLYAKDAEIIWTKMLDFNCKEVGMTHDGYLKVYQLSKPKLYNYDCILIDEAQDMSPALADILLNQSQAKILVGDPHQQIYAFRGAVNAMSRVQSTTIFYLTQSFRFGPEIAQIAACCLETLKEEKMKTLVGNGKKCEITGKTVGQVAIICRSNYTVFNEAVKKCCFRDQDNIKIGFVGGTDGFGFPKLLDIYTLMMSPEQRQKENRVVQDHFIKKFHNMGELEKYANKTQDPELLGKIKIVRTHHHCLPSYISKILSRCVKDLKAADFILSTAHKAKGLEFSTVRVTDDYGVNPILQMLFRHVPEIAQAMPANAREINMDEGNLLYVAVTRAKHAVQMSSTVKTILQLCGERFEHPVCSQVLQQQGVTMKCRETDQEFKPYALTVQKETVKMSDEKSVDGGVLSPDIITDQRANIRTPTLWTTRQG